SVNIAGTFDSVIYRKCKQKLRMPTSCSAPGCTQRFVKDSGVRFFRFPKEKERRLKWLLAIGRRSLSDRQHVKLWEPSDHDRLCSMHFAEDTNFGINGTPSKDQYHQDYIPSVFSFATTAKQPEQTPARADRFKRLQRRRLVLTPNDKENHQPANDQDEIAEALLMLGHDLPQSCDQGTDPGPDPIQEELDNLKADYTSLQKDHQRLMCENRDLRADKENKFFIQEPWQP
ncbi:THAP2-like protein, partial [Mya arenaria]